MSDEEAFKILESKDITADIEIKGETQPKETVEGEVEGEIREIPEEDHGLTELLEMVINFTDDHARELQRKGFEVPTVNKPLWENFGKPLLNKAFWFYLPEGDHVDDPRIALIAGSAVTVMAVAPSLVGIVKHYRKQEEDEKKKIREEKVKTVKQVQKEAVKEAAKQAEMEKQKQLEQAMRESPYLKKVKYEEVIGL